jgi:hypothetical protein
MRHRARYADLWHAARATDDTAAAHAWDWALIRVEADIRSVEDDIRASPIYSVANIVDRAVVAHNRGDAAAFVAELVRGVADEIGRV